MSLLPLVVVALIRGVTEFLPIDFSGHQELVRALTDWPAQGPVIDLAVQLGVLGAVSVYFAADIGRMVAGVFRRLGGRRNADATLAFLIVVGTVPVVAAGYAMVRYLPDGLGGIEVVAWSTLGFGVLLWVADSTGMTIRRIEHLGLSDAVVVGLAQALMLVPGASRSGVAMSAARVLGMERSDAARFAMLLGIPAILGVCLLKGFEVAQNAEAAFTGSVLTAAAIAFGTGLIAIGFLMAWLRHGGFGPFVLYRLLLGAGLLALVYL